MIGQTLNVGREWPTLAFLSAIFSNLFLVGLDWFQHFSVVNGHIVFSEFGIDPKHNGVYLMLNLPAWSLAVECAFYAMAPFIVRSFRRTVVMVGIGLTYCLWMRFGASPELSQQVRLESYFPFQMLFFGLGSMAYWMHKSGSVKAAHQYLLFVMVCSLTYVSNLPGGSMLYLGIALSCGCLFDLTKSNRFDQFLGDLSYPIYILQIPAGTLLRSQFMTSPTPMAYVLFALAVSIAAYFIVDVPVERFRKTLTKKILARARGIQTAAVAPVTGINVTS